MAEKVTSMRLNEEDLEQFRAFIKEHECSNQAEAFKSLLDMVKLENTKEKLGDRAKEIEAFKDTINRAIGMYVNSLEVNQATEQNIREDLSKELSTKDNTITNIYEQLQGLKADKIALEGNFKEVDNKSKELQEQLQKSNIDNIDKQSQLDIANRNNNTLQEQLTEYKEYKNTNKLLEKELEQLKADSSNKDNTINNLENSNKKFQDKIDNNSDMLDFYKNNIAELKGDIEQYKTDNKVLEDKYNKQIENIKEDHTKALEGQLKAITEQLQNKHEVELSKNDLEIEKLKNEIDQLKIKQPKPVTNKTK